MSKALAAGVAGYSVGSLLASVTWKRLGRLRDRQRDRNEPQDRFLGRPRGRLQAQHEDFCELGVLILAPTALLDIGDALSVQMAICR
jgi:hypothetical protein